VPDEVGEDFLDVSDSLIEDAEDDLDIGL